MLRSIYLYLFTDVSGQPIGAIFKGKGSTARPLKTGDRGCPETSVISTDQHCVTSQNIPRAGLDRCGKSHSHRNSIPGPSGP